MPNTPPPTRAAAPPPPPPPPPTQGVRWVVVGGPPAPLPPTLADPYPHVMVADANNNSRMTVCVIRVE